MSINRTHGGHIPRIAFGILLWLAIIPGAMATAPTTPTTLIVDKVWTMDGNNQDKTSFVQGDAIHYGAIVNNGGSSTVKATFTFLASGPTQIYSWTGQGDVASGSPPFYSPSTIPADAPEGTYTLTVTVSYNGQSSSKQSQFTVQASPSNHATNIFVPVVVQIYSEPKGAQIWLDGGNTRKMTPDKFVFDGPGQHTIELQLNGYLNWTESFDIQNEGENITKRVTLTPDLNPDPPINTIPTQTPTPTPISTQTPIPTPTSTQTPTPTITPTVTPTPSPTPTPTPTVTLTPDLKFDLNGDGKPAGAVDINMMLQAAVGDITPNRKFDLNGDGKPAGAVDINMMLQAAVGDIKLDGGS